MKISFVFLLAWISMSFVSQDLQAQTQWTGDRDEDWSNERNWTHGVPDSQTAAWIMDGRVPVKITDLADARGVVIRSDLKPFPSLHIGADLTIHGSGGQADIIVGGHPTDSFYQAEVHHHSGSVSNVRSLRIASIAEPDVVVEGNKGTYIFGGEANRAPSFESQQVTVGARPGEEGLLHLRGHGTFQTTGAVSLSYAHGKSKMIVEGGHLDIQLGGMILNRFNGPGGATLTFIGTDSGFSTIVIRGDMELGQALVFLRVETGEGYRHEPGQRIVLVRLEGGKFTGAGMFRNAADGATLTHGGFSFAVEQTDNEIAIIPN